MDEVENQVEAELTIDDLVERFAIGEPPEDDQDGTDESEETDESVEDESQEDDGETEEEETDESSSEDDAEVSVQVDGKEHKVKVKDLTRLYGQEASLTQKSQAVSAAVKALEAQGLYIAQILEGRLKAAQAKVDKYKDVDLFKASRELEPEEFDALRSAQTAANAEFKALTEEADQFMKRSQQTRTELIRQQAKAALVEIKKAIPEWDDKLYSDIRSYAIGQGMDRDTANEVIDPSAIVMIRKAMLYDQAQTKKANVVKKVTKAPTKVVQKSESKGDYKASKATQAEKKARMTGDIDDIVEAVLASRKNS